MWGAGGAEGGAVELDGAAEGLENGEEILVELCGGGGSVRVEVGVEGGEAGEDEG